jgi:hypothetical protein
MFDELERLIIDLDKDRQIVAHAFVNWVVMLVERIPEPARKYIPLKSERPANYEVIEPQPGQYD